MFTIYIYVYKFESFELQSRKVCASFLSMIPLFWETGLVKCPTWLGSFNGLISYRLFSANVLIVCLNTVCVIEWLWYVLLGPHYCLSEPWYIYQFQYTYNMWENSSKLDFKALLLCIPIGDTYFISLPIRPSKSTMYTHP